LTLRFLTLIETSTFPDTTRLVIAGFRWLEYIGLLGFIGVLVVRRLAANQTTLLWARMPMHPALALALVGGVATLAIPTISSGSADAATMYLFGAPYGWVRAGRVLAEGLALGMCLRGIRLVVVPGLLAVALLPFAGHAASVQPPFAGIAVDVIHVASAGMWAGGIVALATLRPPGGWRGGEGRALLDRFARVAPLAFAITALTGVLRATEELSAVSDLWSTPYGAVLSLKTGGVLLMLGMSWLTWRRGLPLARLEAAIALLVIAATALLAAYPVTPGEATWIIRLI
jgi:putative copper export protein